MIELRHPEVAALVLAAGQGKRMRSDLAKVLHPMAGRPLLALVLEVLDELGVGRTLVVVGHQADQVRAALAEAPVEWVLQAEQRGTGHAVQVAGPALAGFAGTLLVVFGDVPLLRASTLHDLLEEHRASGAAVTVLSTRVPDPTGYGRILRAGGSRGQITAIVEDRDATPEQRRIDEINSGIMAFRYPALVEALSGLSAHNAQAEYYLTDTIGLLLQAGQGVGAVCAPDHRELLGINTVEQLAEAELMYREMKRPVGRIGGTE
ncbi:MAG TPA: NTP transferase domain-containing protein [Candidatus Eisenbacteria bacterium]|jgi:bifunctional UDP-N-acetylglucosamine pyrophosphorylase/glucosamine-1-phosphate N-acetyltransferase